MAHKQFVGIAALVWLVVQPTPAEAARVIKYNVRDHGPFIVPAYTDQTTILSFPSEVELAYSTEAHATQLMVPLLERYSREVRIVPQPNIADAVVHMTVVLTETKLAVELHFVNRSATPAYDRAEFYDGHVVQQQVLAQCDTRFDQSLALLLLQGVTIRSLRTESSAVDDALALRRTQLVTLGDRHQFLFTLTNRSDKWLRLQTIRVYDEARKSEHTRYLQVHSDSQPASNAAYLAELPPRQSANVMLAVDALAHLGTGAHLEFIGAGGLALGTRHIKFFEPEDPPNKGRIAVLAQFVGGALSFTNRADATQNDFAALRGVGAGAVYGLTGYASLEGSLTLLSTRDAAFSDSSTAHASSVRALIGGSLHAGTTYVPYVRVGLGVRGSYYTWDPATGEPASEGRFSGLWTLGAGVDGWLTKSFVVGLSAGYVGPFGGGDDDSYSLEAAAHAGYAWKP